MGEFTAAADVYADDTAKVRRSAESSDVVYSFSILAEGEPDALARIANTFNLANVAPLSVVLRQIETGHLQMTVELTHVLATTADSIRRKLAQLTCVIQVEIGSPPLNSVPDISI